MLRIHLSQLTQQEVQALLMLCMEKHFPDKMKFKPRVIAYDNEHLRFGMAKHNGVLTMKIITHFNG